MSDQVSTLKTQAEIQEWLSDYIMEALDLPKEDIDVEASFETFGIDSITMVEISYQVGEWLNIEIDPKSLYNYPSIAAVSAYLEGLTIKEHG
ncbi:MAG: acyl carrier protein [Flavobacteriales bacterium]|jgi:acyl carrier protein|nr:acyl carrier protein [Flavobacteriales bacterium]